MWLFTTVVFNKITLAPIYSIGEVFFFFQFALLFRKINVYVQNIIHHALKAEVIQEMIAGKIRSSTTETHTHHTHTHTNCTQTHVYEHTTIQELPHTPCLDFAKCTEEKTLKVSVKEILTDKVKSQTFSKKKVLWQYYGNIIVLWYTYHDTERLPQQHLLGTPIVVFPISPNNI